MYKGIRFRPLFLKTAVFTALVGNFAPTIAKEGMWLPPTLKNRENDMKKMGLEIPCRLYTSRCV